MWRNDAERAAVMAACSASIPSLDFLKSSPPTAALRLKSVPAGADVKVLGQTCRTPCELTLQVTGLSATFELRGYEPQTISVRSETSGALSAPRFVPNPVHADLQPVAASAKKRISKKMPVATSPVNPPVPVSAALPTSPSAAEATAPSTDTPSPPLAEVK